MTDERIERVREHLPSLLAQPRADLDSLERELTELREERPHPNATWNSAADERIREQLTAAREVVEAARGYRLTYLAELPQAQAAARKVLFDCLSHHDEVVP